MKYLFLILSLSIIGSANGQTFLGKRFKASVGTSLALPMNGFFEINNSSVDTYSGGSLFPPKIEGRIGIALASRIEFDIYAAYQGLQNTGAIITGENFTYALHHTHTDTFMMRTNAAYFGCDFKFYSEYAPIGKYFTLGFGYTKANSIVYPTIHRTIENNYSTQQDYAKTDIYKLPTWETNSSFFSLELGIGKSKLLSPNLFIDYGVKSSIYIISKNNAVNGYDSFADVDTYNYQEASKSLTNRTTWANIQSSNLFQFYVTFGFIK